jgi:hypothetical protein
MVALHPKSGCSRFPSRFPDCLASSTTRSPRRSSHYLDAATETRSKQSFVRVLIRVITGTAWLSISTRGMNMFDSEQNARAWTLAYLYSDDAHWSIGVDGLRIDGSLQQRELKGLPPAAIEQKLQLSVRYSF